MTDPTSLVGRTIGRRYRIEELVGGGAMGDVYRARHTGLGTDVAVKIMRPSIASEGKFKERFYREAKAASRLEHPNSVRVLDFGEEDDGLVYLAMEFLRGRDLLRILRDEWPLSDERIIDILAQTLAALSVAHANGIVHRDLKPENIMIVADEDDERRDCVKVCDFGIAKLTDPRAFKSKEDVTTALTVGHALVGTPEYMSPEQARGDPLDLRADLYSLGVVLYRLLTGRLPFEAENVIGLAVKHIMEEPKPPSQICPNVNPRLEEICLRAMKKDPGLRFQNAKEMRAALRSVLAAVPVSGGSSSPRASRSSTSGAPTSMPVSSDAYAHDTVISRPPTAVESAPTLRDGFASKETKEKDHQPQPRASASSSPAQATPSSSLDGDAALVVPVDGPNRRILLSIVLAVLGLAGIWLIFDSVKRRLLSDAGGSGLVASATGSAPSASPTTPTTLLALTEPPTMTSSSGTSRHGAIRTPSSSGRVPSPTAPNVTSVSAGTMAHGQPPVPPLPTPTAPSAAPPTPTQPPPPPPPPPTPTSAPTPAPAGSYKPTNASVTLMPLVAERVQRDVIERKIAELMPRLNDCYRDALFYVGSPIGGIAEIQMSVDASGRVVSTVIAGQLPQFQRCASRLVQSFSVPSSSVESGGGIASQTLKLTP